MRRRPTIAEARVKKEMRRGERRSKAATRTAAHAAHRDGLKTVASHLRALGVDETTATGMAATLRKRISGGVKGFAKKNGVRRACTRYTHSQVMAALVEYKPRKAEFKDARANLLALAA